MDSKSTHQHKRITTRSCNRKDDLQIGNKNVTDTASVAPCLVCGALPTGIYFDRKSTNDVNRVDDQAKSFCSACKDFYCRSTSHDAHLGYVCVTQGRINRRVSLRSSRLLTQSSELCAIKTDIVNKCLSCWYLKCLSFGINEIIDAVDVNQSPSYTKDLNDKRVDGTNDLELPGNPSTSAPSIVSVDVTGKTKPTQHESFQQSIRSEFAERTIISVIKQKKSTQPKQLIESSPMDCPHPAKEISISSASIEQVSSQNTIEKTHTVLNDHKKSATPVKSIIRREGTTKTTEAQPKTSVSFQTKGLVKGGSESKETHKKVPAEKAEGIVLTPDECVCRVCGDTASTIHYGVLTCPDCVLFYR
ncbi:hypothetical protein Ahia01_001400700, partial [Argonauta hians]